MTENFIGLKPLPFITETLTGTGGEIKANPSYFVVEEIPLYEPCGNGEHIYLNITKENLTTTEIKRGLARIFKVRDFDIGYAGMKDKHARTTQTFSLVMRDIDEKTAMEMVEDSIPVKVNWTKRHLNKLRIGHLIGNRFEIVVKNPAGNALELAEKIASSIADKGLPNFFGIQRFGFNGDNAMRGKGILLNGRKKHNPRMRNFLISSFTSALFNDYLAMRIENGWFEKLFQGDIAKKTDTGGIFEVENISEESPRFERREITYTGPIFGDKMRWANGEPGELEKSVFDGSEITLDIFRKLQVNGSRRPARIFIDDLTISPHPEGLIFKFSMPKGSYATILLREFMKNDNQDFPEED